MLSYIINVIEKTFHYPKLIFSKTRNPDMGKSSFKVTMGVMPDYTFDGLGMRIDGVTENKPAFKAGLKTGDIVIKIGEFIIKDLQTYMKALSKYEKGQTTTIEVIRNGELKVFNLTF